MAERDRRGPGSRIRPPATARGSSRPRQAPRPDRHTQAASSVTVSAPTFVDLSADEERRAVEALAELLVPLLLRTAPPGPGTEAPTVTASGDA
jgi:hypothetical protein